MELKKSKITQLLIDNTMGQDVSPKERFEVIAKEGYKMNPFVYIGVKKYVDAIAGLEFLVQNGDSLIKNHPAAQFFNGKPNVLQSKGEFWWSYLLNLYLGGEGIIEGIFARDGTVIKEMYTRRPDRIDLILGNASKPIKAYKYTLNNPKIIPSENVSFLKFPDPLNDWRGMSPFTPASYSVDLNNNYKKHSIAYLNNGARPSGILSTEQKMSANDIKLYKEELQKKYSGTNNTGRPLVLGGGLKWLKTGSTPIEMSYIAGQKMTADEIAMIMVVPSVLLNKDATYENQQEARKLFYNDGVLPLTTFITQEMTEWLRLHSILGPNDRLVVNKKKISALADSSKDTFEQALSGWDKGLLTRNEARVMIGLPSIKNQDIYKKTSKESYVDTEGIPTEPTEPTEIEPDNTVVDEGGD